MRLGPIEFTTGELVSGPSEIFSIFGFPITSTVVTTWFILLCFFVFLENFNQFLKEFMNF